MPISKEILKPGNFIDSFGQEVTFTERHLKRVVENFNEKNRVNALNQKVPLTIAHPKSNSPAFGWVSKLYMKGKNVWAEFEDVADVAQKWIREKMFREVSAALIGKVDNLNLRHVGMLGAWPPAIPGLKDFKFQSFEEAEFEFAEDEYSEYEFVDENPDEEKKTALNKIFQMLKGLVGANDKFDKFKAEIMAMLKSSKKELNMPKTVEELEAENKTLTENSTQLTSDLEAEKTKSTDFEKQFTDEKKGHDKLKTELSEAETKTLDAEDDVLIEKLKTEFKVSPAQKELIIVTLKSKRGLEEIEFADPADEKKKIKATPRDHYIKLLNDLPPVIVDMEFGEETSATGSKTDSKIQKLVKEKMDKDPKMTHSEASEMVFAEHPGLTTMSADKAEGGEQK